MQWRDVQVTQVLRRLVSALLLTASVLIGVPFAWLGLMGLTGNLADASYQFNVQVGLQSLGICLLVWGVSAIWFWWLWSGAPRLHFSLQTLLVVAVLVAFVLWLVIALFSLPEVS